MKRLSLVILGALLGCLPACSWHKKMGSAGKKSSKQEKKRTSFDESLEETSTVKRVSHNPSQSVRTVYYEEDDE